MIAAIHLRLIMAYAIQFSSATAQISVKTPCLIQMFSIQI